jgi:hypothetical protein
VQQWNRRLTEEEWHLSQELKDLLVGSQEAMKVFQSQNQPTISQVFPFIYAIRKKCKNILESISKPPIIRKTAMVIAAGLKNRFSSLLDDPLYALATLVDPNTKKFYNLMPPHVQKALEEYLSQKLNHTHQAIVQTTTATTTSSILDWSYDGLPPIADSPFNLSKYINSSFEQYPTVSSFLAEYPRYFSELYLSICGIPAASSEIERLFSTCGFINSKLRCSMTPANLEQRCLIKKNTHVTESFKKSREFYPTSTPKLVDWAEIPLKWTFFDEEPVVAEYIEGFILVTFFLIIHIRIE